MPATQMTTLQSLLWPEPGISTERELYMRLAGPVAFSMNAPCLTFGRGGSADFSTAANVFNLGKWRRHCGLVDLRLRLDGIGSFELVVFCAQTGQSREPLVNTLVELSLDKPLSVDVTPHIAAHASTGVLFFTLRALGDARLNGAAWVTATLPTRLPKLAVSITTYKREAAVQETAERFERFIARSSLAPRLHLFVVDNGQSANIPASDHVTPIANANLGGSGGFARGLLEAEARGFSHCLFMDDDASVHMEALVRTWAFLAYATDPKTAVAGGLTSAENPWSLWESGAIFDRFCRPQWMGTDLRAFDDVVRMEEASTVPKPHNFYGGWWFFAFSIAETRHWPFPFFVRGDDISFSIANDFEIVTLPGVICFQDTDFAEKESLQTLYLDLRSHLVHHLALPSMDIGLRGTLGIPLWFFIRSLMQSHYDTLAALNLALEDVLQGPGFFAENADMSERRARIAKKRQTENWVPLTGQPPESRRRFDPRRSRFWLLLTVNTLNGHLLPFFGLWGNHVTLKSSQRGNLQEVWGAARITYVNADGTQILTVRHSKLAALKQSFRMAKNLGKLALRYPAIKKEWQRGYEGIATRDFWQRTFKSS